MTTKPEMFSIKHKKSSIVINSPKDKVLKDISKVNSKLEYLPVDQHIKVVNQRNDFNIVDTKNDLVMNISKEELLDDISKKKKELPKPNKSTLQIIQKNNTIVIYDTITKISISTFQTSFQLSKRFGRFWRSKIKDLTLYILSWYVDYATAWVRLFFMDPLFMLKFMERQVDFNKMLWDLRGQRAIMNKIDTLKKK